MRTIGQAMVESGVPRSEIFLVSKLGSQLAMGDAEFKFQMDAVLKMYQVNHGCIRPSVCLHARALFGAWVPAYQDWNLYLNDAYTRIHTHTHT